MASSIHTIYRPLARSRKHSIGPVSHRRVADATYAGPLQEEELTLSIPSDEDASDDDADDFEVATPRQSNPETPLIARAPPLTGISMLDRANFSRTGSMATVRLHRRAMLAEKLREIYELDDIEEVRAGMHLGHLPLFLANAVYRNALLVAEVDS